MNRVRKLGLLSILILLVPAAHAAIVSANATRITRVMAYTSFGNGDIAVWAQGLAQGCDGYWFRTTEINGKEIYAQFMVAQQTQQPLWIWADDAQIWTGTSSRFCKIYSIANEN